MASGGLENWGPQPCGALGKPGRTIIHRIFEANSGFHVFSWEIVHYGKSLISVFKGFLLVLTKFSFSRGDWALDYYSMYFTHFPDIS